MFKQITIFLCISSFCLINGKLFYFIILWKWNWANKYSSTWKFKDIDMAPTASNPVSAVSSAVSNLASPVGDHSNDDNYTPMDPMSAVSNAVSDVTSMLGGSSSNSMGQDSMTSPFQSSPMQVMASGGQI